MEKLHAAAGDMIWDADLPQRTVKRTAAGNFLEAVSPEVVQRWGLRVRFAGESVVGVRVVEPGQMRQQFLRIPSHTVHQKPGVDADPHLRPRAQAIRLLRRPGSRVPAAAHVQRALFPDT